MVHARRLALLLGTLALVGTVVSTGGYSAMSAERGASVDVVSDERAYLGVEVTEVGSADERTAISFVGFCTAGGNNGLDPEAEVTKYKSEVDRANATREPLAARWSIDKPVTTVVVKAGDTIENFAYGGNESGTVAVGSGAEASHNQTPSDYCPSGEHEAGKLETPEDFGVASDATPADDGRALRVRISNRFADPLTTVEVTAAGETKTLVDGSETRIGVGESVTFTFQADCTAVEVFAASESARVRLERTCSGPPLRPLSTG